ncbi:THO complex subunit 3-like isoform X2 [Watersipora subatra]|uniref:THO complex subunit 3-like isoform X2 n=1 Tax=Watersipora subatra TaxID=2589382 RepID=UPI00355B9347
MAASIESLPDFFKSNSRIEEAQYHKGKVHSVGWSCDGRKLASGSTDRTVCTYSIDRERLSRDCHFKGHSDTVDQLTWHPKHPDKLATASSDKSVRLFDARTNKCSSIIQTKGENINLSWSPDGQTIAVGNKEDLITFIDTRTCKAKFEEQFKLEVNEFSWSKDGSLFFLTTGLGSIIIHSYPDMKLLHTQPAHSSNCICIKFDQSGQYFATGSADALMSLWDISDLTCLRTFSRLVWPVRTISFSHDTQIIASASEDPFIDIASTFTGEQLATIKCEAQTFEIAWHPKRHLLAIAGDEKDRYDSSKDAGIVKVWGFPGEANYSQKSSQNTPKPLMAMSLP